MQNNSLSKPIRLILSLCGIFLIGVLFIPMWRIDLDAPQYPEGLRLLIYPNKLGGNVDIINGLNHYIGMKTLHTEDFFEFIVLPYIISLFAIAFLAVALFNKRKLMYILFFSFVTFGIIAMTDFWKWEYNYGHNLNPDAAIIVPGMAYQPPLIGFKQLLNFGAYSIPDIGGWLFLSAGALLAFCLILDRRTVRKSKLKTNTTVIALLIISMMTSCSVDPSPFKLGVDNCSYCSMTITNPRFGAEVITMKGKIFKYDDLGCLLSQIKEGELKKADIRQIYSADFADKNTLTPIEKCHLLESEELHSPMGSNIATFTNADSLKSFAIRNSGKEIDWKLLYN